MPEKSLSKPDFVLSLPLSLFPQKSQLDNTEAKTSLLQYLKQISIAGFQFKLSQNKNHLYVYMNGTEQLLNREWKKMKLNDWMHNIGDLDWHPSNQTSKTDTISYANRIRLFHHVLETVEMDELLKTKCVLYTPHPKEFIEKYIRESTLKMWMSDRDLEELKNWYGEEIALYFGFLQFYFGGLILPSFVGLVVYFFGYGGLFLAMINTLWSLAFIKLWERREKELAHQWKVNNLQNSQSPNPDFKPSTTTMDPITQQPKPTYPKLQRLQTICYNNLQLSCYIILFVLSLCFLFILQTYLQYVYTGTSLEYIQFLPTILIAVLIPKVGQYCVPLIEKMISKENWTFLEERDWEFIIRVFVLDFWGYYSGVLVKGLIWIPFGSQILSFFTGGSGTTNSNLDSHELFKEDVKWFIMTGQVLNLIQEIFVPMIVRYFTGANTTAVSTIAPNKSTPPSTTAVMNAPTDEVQKEALLEEYTVNSDYEEMMIQFGYITIFGSIFPLTAFFGFINNWIEFRSDLVKMSINYRKGLVRRKESIGPWLAILKFLSVLSLYLQCFWFTNSITDTLIYIFIFLHIYLGMDQLLSWALKMKPSPMVFEKERELYLLKEKYLKMIGTGEQVSVWSMDDSNVESFCKEALEQVFEKKNE